MQILLALIAGTAIGLAVHFLIPNRDVRGAAVAPILGALSAGIGWTVLTWTGVGIDSPWPWLAAIVVPAAVVYPAVLALTRARIVRDDRERARLKIG